MKPYEAGINISEFSGRTLLYKKIRKILITSINMPIERL
jgi:hypothetical protein